MRLERRKKRRVAMETRTTAENDLEDMFRNGINHIMVTEFAMFPCYRSIRFENNNQMEFDEEGSPILREYDPSAFYVMDCLYKGRRRIITLDEDFVLYIIENYSDEVWDDIVNVCAASLGEKKDEPHKVIRSSIYG